MKNILNFFKYSLLLVIFSALIFNTGKVFALQEDTSKEEADVEMIELMDVTMVVHPDNSVSITEKIVYNFANEEDRHGIYRTIPLSDAVGTFDRLSITNIQTSEENVTDSFFPDFIENNRTSVDLKIGNPDVVVTGLHTYIISYTAHNLIGFFDDRDEIYWNITGNEWDVPILEAQANIFLPGKVENSDLKLASYCGFSGSNTPCGKAVTTFDSETNMTKVSFTTANENLDYLSSYQGMTVAVGFPKGIVRMPTATEVAIKNFQRYWFVPFPILITFWWYRKSLRYWWRRRKYYQRNPIIPEYDPGEVEPIETAGLLHGYIKEDSISAEIISLAIRGYIKIKTVDDEYNFIATNKETEGLPQYDKDLLDGISGKSQSDLTDSFRVIAINIISNVMSSLYARKYISSAQTSLSFMKNSFRSFPVLFLSLFLALNPGAFIWVLVGWQAGALFSSSCVLIGLMGVVFQTRKNKLTDKGFETERRMLGLKLYISVAEEDRIKFHNSPEKSPELFEKLLPYAMIFGLEKKWAKEFENIYTMEPSWYPSSAGTAFSAVAFASSLSDFSSSNTTTLFSSPMSTSYSGRSGSSFGSSGSSSGSSGGGSSGGGGGGGGGGSW